MSFYEKKIKSPLSHLDQLSYLKLAQKGDKKALEILTEHNLGLIANIIYKYYSNYNEDIQTDLFSVGCISLVKSIHNFKLDNPNAFSTYATTYIISEMKQFISTNNLLHISRKIQELYKKIIALQNDKKLSIKEIANILEISEYEVIEALLYKQRIYSITEPKLQNVNDGSKISLKDIIPDKSISLYKDLEKKEIYHLLIEALDMLKPIEKDMIKLSFGLNTEKKTQKEIAIIYNMSQANVSRIIKKGLYEIKQLLPQSLASEYKTKKKV